MNRGTMTTFSGFDGAGKSTNCELLAKNISKHENYLSLLDIVQNEEYENLSTLNSIYEMFSEKEVVITRFYLRSSRTAEIQNSIMYADNSIFQKKALIKELSLLACEDAFLWRDRIIEPLLKQGTHIIFDRYFYDEVAYRALYGIEKKWIENLYVDYPLPDLSIYLDLNVDNVIKRNTQREDINTTLFKNREKMLELYKNWSYIVEQFGLTTIKADDQLNNIQNKIFSLWSKKINEKSNSDASCTVKI